ncbi:MAG: hypothetical protein Q9169_006867 [Polycauliona sp. 2 TL-2023]
MHCNVCQRPETTALPFNCVACARNVLYQSRVSLAHTLLEQEAAVSQSEQYLRDAHIVPIEAPSSHITSSPDSPRSLNLDTANIQREVTRHQTLLTLDQAKQVQRDIDDLRREISRRRRENQERRNDLLAARKELSHRRTVELGRLKKSIAGVHTRWNAMYARTAESRLLLCREAASLYGLKKHIDRAAPSASDDTHYIGGLPIFNLKELNSADPAVVTAVTASLAHLVHLTSHYLALRLPAEVVLPHHDSPLPIILTPESSYTTKTTPNFGASPGINLSRATSSDKDILHSNQRLSLKSLYARKRLAATAKEDPQTYVEVVQGITLLAWNVAWLCKIQGLDIGANSWEELCDLGKNLWKLLAAELASSPPETDASRRVIKHDDKLDAALSTAQQPPRSDSSIAFGQFSHGTVHSNLATASGHNIVHGWRLQDPIRIVAKVKQMLSTDRTGTGWEMLEGKEWESQVIRSQQAEPNAVMDASTVVIAGKSGATKLPRSTSLDPQDPVMDDTQEKIKGTSGWTKLKSR